MNHELIVAKYFPENGNVDILRVLTCVSRLQCRQYMDRRANAHNVPRNGDHLSYTREDGVVVTYRILHA